MKKPEPFYGIKISQSEATKRGNRKKKKRRDNIKELFGNGIISKHVISNTFR